MAVTGAAKKINEALKTSFIDSSHKHEKADHIEILRTMRDEKYKDFQTRLIPTIDPETVIGVRTPELRRFAKELAKEDGAKGFLKDLPHGYFEENQLHAFIISGIKDYDECIVEVCAFLPYIDNWATCDQLSPKVFRKHRQDLLKHIRRWIESKETYTVRFGVGMLMIHFLEEDFDPEYLEMVAGIKSDEYYVNMMRAWYFATALAKQYEAALPFIEEKMLDKWTHNKSIQKALESYRVPEEHKDYLRGLKVK